jgi:hypothetical protein
MALPLELSRLTVICGGLPEPMMEQGTDKQRTTRDGEPMFRTQIVVLGSGRPEVFGVRTTKEPKGLAIGAPVHITGCTISTFTTKDGTTGVFYDAGAVEAARATKEAS